MVATRAQRAQTKDEPAVPKKGALREPARRGKKAEAETPAPARKPTRGQPTTAKKTAASAVATPTAKSAAPSTRRTRGKDAVAPENTDPAHEPDADQDSATSAPVKATRKTATKPAPKQTTATTRKRSAKDIEPETARPAKRQTRSRLTEEPEEATQTHTMEDESKKAPVAARATRATRGTKASESRSTAAVKPLAQRITVNAKKPTRKAKADVSEPPAPEVQMEDVEEAPAPDSLRSTRKSSRRAASEEPQEPTSDAPVEPTPAKSAKRSTRKKVLDEVPEVPAEDVEAENEQPAPATPSKSTKEESEKPAEEEVNKAEELNNEPVAEEQHQVSTPVQTPAAPQHQPETPAKPTPAPPKSILKTARSAAKENVPPRTPGPAHYATALPFAEEATPFFRPEHAPSTVSLQARTPGLNKSLLHETPRRAPIATPFKLHPTMSAVKPMLETNSGSILNSPAKKGPLGASTHGMTPMRPTAAKPESKSSLLQTPAKKGLMLPPSTAPVNRQGFQPTQAKSSLLQTCPRKIALPGLLPKSSMTSPSKADEGKMGSSLLSATPRKGYIEPPTQPAFGTSVQDFATQAQNSVLAAEPRRWNTPARTPAQRFATPGKTPAKSLVDADAGSPTPVKKTPAGLKDVNSAIKLLHAASPAMPPATPTEQFVQGVIDKIDQSMSESESVQQESSRAQSQEIEVARSTEEPESQHDQDDIAADLELQHPVAEEMEPCVSPTDLIMSGSETPVGSPRAEPAEDCVAMEEEHIDVPMQDAAPADDAELNEATEFVQDAAPHMEQPISEEPNAVEHHHEDYVEVTPARSEIQFIEDVHDVEEAAPEHEPEVQPAEFASEIIHAEEEQAEEQAVEPTIFEHTTMVQEEIVVETRETPAPEVLARPSTPTMEEQYTAAIAKDKAKTERRARHKRLSMAIELESSIKKPRQSLAFIPSLTPAKSSLRSPFKKPFGSPKKSVAWATEPIQAKIIEESQQPQTPKKVDADLEANIPHPDNGLLTGTAFFVDVRTAEGEDAGDLFIPLLEEMGAKIVNEWNGIDESISHVLFKDGAVETLEKIAAANSAVQAVNIGWVLDCERFNKRVAEEDYQIEVSRLLGNNSPLRTLFALSAANTPARATPAKSAFGTPFALMSLTPKGKPTLSPFADITTTTPKPASTATPIEMDKENTPPTQLLLFKTPTKASPSVTVTAVGAGEFSPSTPYFLHAENITQKTCPPKQSNRGLFDRAAAASTTADGDGKAPLAVTPFRQKMLLARRSLSPAAFGRARGI
ncbi:brct domain-containing protein [Diplodia corticola]|uniref:Brct domain-containing protein n=1 Tax=Diplodia corticola TaxID=236234 RepID=A0A1J9R8L5_9PEZI|nr:brct domain-containing protein [Diplodia corticola]OJD36865.1 brct domain-containing protein [Diplodia corticola]